VHVCKAGTEAVITLDPVSVRSVERMRARDVLRAVELVQEHRALIVGEWRKWHG